MFRRSTGIADNSSPVRSSCTLEHERYAAAARDNRDAGHITILVSHRFSTVRMADRIVVLRHGQVEEEGTHDQLVRRDGLYAELFKMQAEGYR